MGRKQLYAVYHNIRRKENMSGININDMLKQTMIDTQNVYLTAFEEGKKIGYEEGLKEGKRQAKEELDKILKEIEENH